DLSDTPRLKGSMSVGTRFLEPMSSSMRTPIRIYHNSASTARGIGPRLARDGFGIIRRPSSWRSLESAGWCYLKVDPEAKWGQVAGGGRPRGRRCGDW